MKCPICGGDKAYLFSGYEAEPGVSHKNFVDVMEQPGKDLEVQIVCAECGEGSCETVAHIKINITLKPDSLILDEYFAGVKNMPIKLCGTCDNLGFIEETSTQEQMFYCELLPMGKDTYVEIENTMRIPESCPRRSEVK